MKFALLLLIVGLVCVSAYTEDEYRSAFTAWMQKHEKSYSSVDFQRRFTIFKSNMDYARDWNAVNKETILGMTVHADLTNEEYQSIFLGTKFDASSLIAGSQNHNSKQVKDNFNATVDWRSKGIVTPIKNQGQCGSCWSFSTTGSTEGAHAQKTGNLVSLSEQNLMDCSTSYGNQGCNGGLMTAAFQYIITNGGLDTEDSYPYKGVNGKSCEYKAANSGATLSSYANVSTGSETDLATAATKQPVSVAIDASHMSFQLYTGGIYHYDLCSSTRLDHGVLVVGFGTDTTVKENGNYWIVKNSWGTTWGLEGYIYMSKDRNNNCGIATMASYPAA